jgi:hypothetical protein
VAVWGRADIADAQFSHLMRKCAARSTTMVKTGA